jgi:hypothetical protein
VAWTRDYAFKEPLMDLRGSEHAEAFETELQREVAPGHLLHGRSWRVVAKALPNDDVVAECDDIVAVVHLTWSQKQELLPWPETTIIKTVAEFESFVGSAYDWEP